MTTETQFTRYPLASVMVIFCGLVWSALLWNSGWWGTILAFPPAALLLGSGAMTWLNFGDPGMPRMMALGAVFGALAAILGLFSYGFLTSALMLLLSVVSLACSGWLTRYLDLFVDEVPTPELDAGMALKIGLDEATLGYLVLTTSVPYKNADIRRVVHEAEALSEAYAKAGYDKHPEKMHPAPQAFDQAQARSAKLGALRYQHLRFKSDFKANPDLPGAERWPLHPGCAEMHAWMFEHPGEPRPWILGIHGYKMGSPWADIPMFRPRHLYGQLGMNLLLVTLPLHGHRGGLNSGDGFFSGEFSDSVHAVCHAVHDVRAALAWLRKEKQAEQIGLMGFSLGGYHSAVVNGLESGLDCTIAAIPAVDMAELIWQHGPQSPVKALEKAGLDLELARQALMPVSPLSFPSAIDSDKLGIFAGVADRIVPPRQALSLWQHWQKPRIAWYQGGHMSFMGQPSVDRLIQDTLTAGGLIARSE